MNLKQPSFAKIVLCIAVLGSAVSHSVSAEDSPKRDAPDACWAQTKQKGEMIESGQFAFTFRPTVQASVIANFIRDARYSNFRIEDAYSYAEYGIFVTLKAPFVEKRTAKSRGRVNAAILELQKTFQADITKLSCVQQEQQQQEEEEEQPGEGGSSVGTFWNGVKERIFHKTRD